MRPHYPDSPPEKERDREELSFLPDLDLSGTQDENLLREIESYESKFSERKFCVYEHRLQGKTIYLGMGREGDRAFRTTSFRNHNRFWRSLVGSHGRPETVILHSSLTLWEARAEEQRLISDYRKNGNKLVNIRGGGEIPSFKTAWKISRTLRLHAACQRVKRMTEAASLKFTAFQQEFPL